MQRGNVHLPRLARLERGRRLRRLDQRRPARSAKTAKFTIGAHTKVFTDDGARGRARLRRGRHARGRRQHPGRLLQGRGEVGTRRSATIDGERWSVPGRLRERRGRRHDHAARPRLGRHQLGRREDLPRGGRGGGEGAPDGGRLPRRRRARRALRRGRHRGRRRCRRGRVATARRHRPARSRRSRASSGRASSCSSTRSCAGPNGKADYKWAKQRERPTGPERETAAASRRAGRAEPIRFRRDRATSSCPCRPWRARRAS